MTQFAATMAASMGIPAPKAGGAPFSMLGETMKHQGLSTANRVLIYNPDAVGMWLFQKYTTWFAPVLRHTQLGVPIRTTLCDPGVLWNHVHRRGTRRARHSEI